MGYTFHVLIGMRPCKIVSLFFLSYTLAYLILGGVLWSLHDVTEFHGIDNYWEAPPPLVIIRKPYPLPSPQLAPAACANPNAPLPQAVTFIGYTMATVGFGNQYPKVPSMCQHLCAYGFK